MPDVRRAFGVAKRLAGIRDELSLYSIRHTFASWLAIQGHPLRTFQELLDHADVRVTLRYAHLSPAHLQSAVESIGAAEKSIGQRAGNAEAGSEVSDSAANPSGVSGSPTWPKLEPDPRLAHAAGKTEG